MAVLAAIPALTWAQNSTIQTVTLQFEEKGERKAWIQTDENADQIGDLIDASDTTLELASTTDPNGKSVYVRNLNTNKVAKKSLVAILKDGTWKPKASDYTLTYEAKVIAGNAAGRVSNGVINVKAGDQERQVLLISEDNGEVSVYLLPGKQATVSLTTKVEGGEVTTDPQTLDLSTTGEVPTLTLIAPEGAPVVSSANGSAIPEEGETVAGSGEGSGSSSEGESEAAPKGGNPLVTFLNMLVALAIIGGLGYGVWWYIQNNQGKVEELAKKAGLDPSDRKGDPVGDLPVQPSEPEPLKKIMLDGAAVEPIQQGAVAGAAAAATPVAKSPKLVGADGQTHNLAEGQTTVGRENATITVGESSLSRRHAELSRTGGSVTITDLGSTNGTYVNGVKIQSSTVLNPGDTVQFGAAQFTYKE